MTDITNDKKLNLIMLLISKLKFH